MEELLIASLLGFAPLTDLVGDGLHWEKAPQGAAFPCLVIDDVTTSYTHTMQGRVGLTASVVRIDAYAYSKIDVLAIKRALIAWGDANDAPPLPLQAELRSDRGGLEAGEAPPADGVSSSDLRRQTLEFDIWHTPA